ncbi:hypothetical protein PYW08_006058 [Mythimna loreyi]|uniref:Uncharacterized protein n=1 Tax=Mythimna loreyi TaxID=667449 RepID=A0ACC2QM44_9NEOP|nr:hypothetical protein PYW08_006058 [Mythimna loreyi]
MDEIPMDEIPKSANVVPAITHRWHYKTVMTKSKKEAGGKALVLPQDIRWNTLADCLESYVNKWHCLVKVCSEHRTELDLTIVRNVQDVEFKENVENYLKELKKVARALDLIQKDLCVEHRTELDLTIVRNVQDVEFKENVENYLKKLKKVARALDLIQKDLCALSDCTRIWKDLLSSDWLPEDKK